MPWVRPYERADGTSVRGYFRWAAGARKEVAILAAVALEVIVIGNGNGAADTGNGKVPRPRSTVQYPIKFESNTVKMKRPKPTVSYPIPWASSGGDR